MNKFALFLIIFGLTSSLNARVPIRDIVSGIELGTEAGFSMSVLQGLSGQSSRVGFAFGGTGTYQFSPSGHVDTFLGVVQRGSNGDIADVTLNYIYVPILLRYNLPKQETFEPFVYTGLYGAYLLSATSGGDDVDDMFASHDFGWCYGVGIMVPLYERVISVKLGYEMGLRAVYEYAGETAYNRSLTLKAGLRF
jgi:hypothetical protein